MQQKLVKLLIAEFFLKNNIPFHCQTELQTYRIFCWPRGNFYHYIRTEDVRGEKYLKKKHRTRMQEITKVLRCQLWLLKYIYIH